MSMILLEPAYKILHTKVKFKRRTISVTPYYDSYCGAADSRQGNSWYLHTAAFNGTDRLEECLTMRQWPVHASATPGSGLPAHNAVSKDGRVMLMQVIESRL
jgi:hypothetical protein